MLQYSSTDLTLVAFPFIVFNFHNLANLYIYYFCIQIQMNVTLLMEAALMNVSTTKAVLSVAVKRVSFLDLMIKPALVRYTRNDSECLKPLKPQLFTAIVISYIKSYCHVCHLSDDSSVRVFYFSSVSRVMH